MSIFKLIVLISVVVSEILLTRNLICAQTCCSGGVPLANNIGGLPQADKGTFQLFITLDGNYLRTLKDGSERLDDLSRRRITYSALINSAYTITNKFSIGVLLSGVKQERTINQPGGFKDVTKTVGIGDAVAIINYKYFKKRNTEFTISAGPKIPLGPSDLKNNNGITLNADLQPGSGAWDVILHHQIVKKLPLFPSALLTNLITYRMTGQNTGYLGGQLYEFGNEFQTVIGITDQRAFGKILLSYGLNFRYRNVQQDRNNEEWVPSTGGDWLFLMPSVSWYITPAFAITTNGEAPLYSKVSGTQLTPTFRINVGVYKSLTKKKEIININR